MSSKVNRLKNAETVKNIPWTYPGRIRSNVPSSSSRSQIRIRSCLKIDGSLDHANTVYINLVIVMIMINDTNVNKLLLQCFIFSNSRFADNRPYNSQMAKIYRGSSDNRACPIIVFPLNIIITDHKTNQNPP